MEGEGTTEQRKRNKIFNNRKEEKNPTDQVRPITKGFLEIWESCGNIKSDSTPFQSWHSGYLSKSQKKQGLNGPVLFHKNRWNNHLLIAALYKLIK